MDPETASASNNHLDDARTTSAAAIPAKAAPRSAKAKGKKRQLDPETASKLPSAVIAYVPSGDDTVASFSEGFWKHQFDVAENAQEDFKTPELPLARVKRVMKTDPDVVMIASEVPVILEKACQIFISDLTSRAYLDSSRRRTLTKGDVIHATTKSDIFDFLIDVAPRDCLTGGQSNSNNTTNGYNGSNHSSGPGYTNGTSQTASNGIRNGNAQVSSKKGLAAGKKSAAKRRKINDFDEEDEQDDDEEDDNDDDEFNF